jgi:predicted thioesterase
LKLRLKSLELAQARAALEESQIERRRLELEAQMLTEQNRISEGEFARLEVDSAQRIHTLERDVQERQEKVRM